MLDIIDMFVGFSSLMRWCDMFMLVGKVKDLFDLLSYFYPIFILFLSNFYRTQVNLGSDLWVLLSVRH